MGNAINPAGKLIETTHAPDRMASAKTRIDERTRLAQWREVKTAAEDALSATDYLALTDRRPMTDAEKAYREALRAIIRATPTGMPPALPTL